MDILKDSRFWIGAAVGFFVGPMIAKTALTLVRRGKSAAAGG